MDAHSTLLNAVIQVRNFRIFPDVSCLDPDRLENAAAVLQTLEELLTKYDASILSQESKYLHFGVAN